MKSVLYVFYNVDALMVIILSGLSKNWLVSDYPSGTCDTRAVKTRVCKNKELQQHPHSFSFVITPRSPPLFVPSPFVSSSLFRLISCYIWISMIHLCIPSFMRIRKTLAKAQGQLRPYEPPPSDPCVPPSSSNNSVDGYSGLTCQLNQSPWDVYPNHRFVKCSFKVRSQIGLIVLISNY
jgi:hypothetical protein